MGQTYCLIQNGKIETPRYLTVNQKQMTETELNAVNFYKYVIPTINYFTQNMGAYIFDSENNVVTRTIVDLVIDVETLKTKLLTELNYVEQTIIYRKWDWMIAREFKHGILMTQESKDEELVFKAYCDGLEIEINGLVETNILQYSVTSKILEYDSTFDSYLKNIQL